MKFLNDEWDAQGVVLSKKSFRVRVLFSYRFWFHVFDLGIYKTRRFKTMNISISSFKRLERLQGIPPVFLSYASTSNNAVFLHLTETPVKMKRL